MFNIENYNNIYSFISDVFDTFCLGDEVTKEMSDAIAEKDFSNLQVGKYWKIDGECYRIMAQDQFFGYNGIDRHHLVVMPATPQFIRPFNFGDDNSEGGVFNSTICDVLEEEYNPLILEHFGKDHIIEHTHDLTSTMGGLIRLKGVKSWLINSYNYSGVKYDGEQIYLWQEPDVKRFEGFKCLEGLHPNMKWMVNSSRSWWLGTASNYRFTNDNGETEDKYECACLISSRGYLDWDQTTFAAGIRPAFLVY